MNLIYLPQKRRSIGVELGTFVCAKKWKKYLISVKSIKTTRFVLKFFNGAQEIKRPDATHALTPNQFNC
jgi:hypothetical protein